MRQVFWHQCKLVCKRIARTLAAASSAEIDWKKGYELLRSEFGDAVLLSVPLLKKTWNQRRVDDSDANPFLGHV